MNEYSNKRALCHIVVALILVIGIITSSIIMINGVVKVKASKTNIIVTGSAKQKITSDLIVWTGSFTSQSKKLQDAYTKLEVSRNKVSDYLVKQGIAKDDFVFSSINTTTNYVMNSMGNYTNEIDNYVLSQTVTISSSQIDKITEISRNATELLNQEVAFQSNPPQYFYTKLADLKVSMLAEATKDAKKRGKMIAENAGNHLGDLKYADMGVMQITPLYSNEIADAGVNDTSSLEKEITAVVHCQFEIEK
ncbi:SIMPL domain-containing protein [Anaeromicropila herbilytica]|uniref:SIMPL domain-containing protein n=1 Tax=Anaeromicropila herbilytica TaxID=2785025 RepID=A0A7R7EKH7_9FIRM|nr:SIMPL domain-containing protein [Anaeromicropila herbilytica]BCN30790.1 SIMPL domain-containing protein [Anaeromicropila herbilytica]